MKTSGQLFVRGIYSSKEPNTYMVCGIIKTDAPLEVETTHIFDAHLVDILESRSVKEIARGNGFDGIMTSPIWKIKVF